MHPWRDALLLHILLAAAAAAVFTWLRPPQLGLGLLGVVVGYNLLLPLFAQRQGHHEWVELWLFLLPLSLMQVLPDWVLSRQFGVLDFPDLGGPRLDTVPAYMAGMWVIPLIWVLWLAGRSLLFAGIVALLLLGAAEWAARPLQLWHAQHVPAYMGVAFYVLPAELLLGSACAYSFLRSRESAFPIRIGAAACVSIFYTGALVLGLFLSARVSIPVLR